MTNITHGDIIFLLISIVEMNDAWPLESQVEQLVGFGLMRAE